MSTDEAIEDCIDAAADVVGSVWPLHSFVTANPLAGFEDEPFHEAVETAQQLRGGDGYPNADVFRRAWESGRIDPEILQTQLSVHGYDIGPEGSLDRMERAASESNPESTTTATDRVDAVLTKWLAAFLDQGTAEWSMPNREQGFYDAFRAVAGYDHEIPADGSALSAEPIDVIRDCLAAYPVGEWRDVFEFHLAALPGWTGFLKQRADDETDWHSTYPITLSGYLAVRLWLTDAFDAPMTPSEAPDEGDSGRAVDDGDVPLAEVWLTAWEGTYRSELVETVADGSASLPVEDGDRPDAQLVFCIDTRSEIVRRHIEASGDYETHGYAGFFGIPMRYEGYDSAVTVDACPPIVDVEHRIADRPTSKRDDEHATYDRWTELLTTGKETVKHLKSNAATAFNFVESSGAGYGAALAARTLLPARVYDLLDGVDERTPDDHEFCAPSIEYNPDSVNDLREGLTLEEKVEYAASAFELMGWDHFARVVVFAGHASHTTNNPFDSSLDCGACAGNPGGPNARTLAAICNDEAVLTRLRERGIDIPEDTVFLAAEHDTTTDEVELFDIGVPESHESDVEQLRADLESARAGAAAERADDMGVETDAGVREVERRAADWAETRPEWGLAGNAGFVIGPPALTDDVDLDGRSFLHSYDWSNDPDGDALEAIMTGPMVVTQWINAQYYFATVDNAVYGGGSKVTHNPVGNVGVYQGNGGDLMTGLPLQSLFSADDDPYHQPLRLSTVVHAPVERVTDVLAEHDDVAGLLDNGWLSLTVVDPTQDHRAFHYEGDLSWTPVADQPVATPHLQASPAPADD